MHIDKPKITPGVTPFCRFGKEKRTRVVYIFAVVGCICTLTVFVPK